MPINHPRIQHHTTVHHRSFPRPNHPSVQHTGGERSIQKYYWIWAMSNKTGAAIIYGYRNSELEARKVADRITNAECEIVPLDTKDEGEASRRIRAMKLGKSNDVDSMLKRFKHEHM
jgi:hypothetical protein